MDQAETLPKGFASFLVPDRAFAAAYEAVPAHRRAWLKTTIAALHALYAEKPVIQTVHTSMPRNGMIVGDDCRPVSWTVIVMDASFASGPRLLGALMPALLAGVPDVSVVRMASDGSQWPDALLASLELAGQEKALALEPEAATAFIATLAEGQRGRVVLLGAQAFHDSLAAVIRCHGLPVWHESRPPTLVLEAGAAVDSDVVAWAHPDARMLKQEPGLSVSCEKGGTIPSAASPERSAHHEAEACPDAGARAQGLVPSHVVTDTLSQSESAAESYGPATGCGEVASAREESLFRHVDAVYCDAHVSGAWLGRVPLVLTPGREGCWIYPGLTPAFFLERSLSLSAATPVIPFLAETLHAH